MGSAAGHASQGVSRKQATPSIGLPGDCSKKYWRKCRINGGRRSEVWLVQHGESSVQYAAKLIRIPTMVDEAQEEAYAEMMALQKVSHHGVVRYVEDFADGGTLGFVTELADGGDLGRQIQRRHREKDWFQEDTLLFLFVQMGVALDYLHSLQLLHRKVKSSNIFLTSECLVKLGGFGLSCDHEEAVARGGPESSGAHSYLAPELWHGQDYTRKADMWSLGVVLCEMALLRLPAATHPVPEPLPERYSKGLGTVAQTLLTEDPRLRPITRRLFLMPYMRRVLKRYEASVEACTSMSPDTKEALLADAAAMQNAQTDLSTPTQDRQSTTYSEWSSSTTKTPMSDLHAMDRRQASELRTPDGEVKFEFHTAPCLSQTIPQDAAPLSTALVRFPPCCAPPKACLRRSPSDKSDKADPAVQPTSDPSWVPCGPQGHEGAVLKRGTDGTWQSGRLHLTDELLVFCNSEGAKGKALSLSRIRTLFVAPDGDAAHAFVIETLNGKSTWLRASSAEEADAWCAAIRRGMEMAQP